MNKLSEVIYYIFKIVLIGVFSIVTGVIIAYFLTWFLGEDSFDTVSIYSSVFLAAHGGYDFRKVEERERY